MFTFPRLLVFAALIVSGAQADTCGAVKSVPFHTFMNSSLFANVPLSVLIPAEYQFANLNAAPPTYSYLMTPEGAEAVRKTGDLPVSTGFNFGKISTDVGYDAAMDVLLARKNLSHRPRPRVSLMSVLSEPLSNGHALIFVEMTEKTSRKKIYA